MWHWWHSLRGDKRINHSYAHENISSRQQQQIIFHKNPHTVVVKFTLWIKAAFSLLCLSDQLRARYARWNQKGVSRTCSRGFSCWQIKTLLCLVFLLFVAHTIEEKRNRSSIQQVGSSGHTPITDHWPHPNPWKTPQKNPGIIRYLPLRVNRVSVSLFGNKNSLWLIRKIHRLALTWAPGR